MSQNPSQNCYTFNYWLILICSIIEISKSSRQFPQEHLCFWISRSRSLWSESSSIPKSICMTKSTCSRKAQNRMRSDFSAAHVEAHHTFCFSQNLCAPLLWIWFTSLFANEVSTFTVAVMHFKCSSNHNSNHNVKSSLIYHIFIYIMCVIDENERKNVRVQRKNFKNCSL